MSHAAESTLAQVGHQLPVDEKQRRSISALVSVVISGVLLIPCFWQAHIQCADLPSHLYNAWLYTQARAGHLPGLTIVSQKTNILVDILLVRSLGWWGPLWAERVVVGLAVLIFFWGAFRLATVVAARRPWHLAPLLAMLSYGVIFRWGFLNFYLSLGLCLWAAAFAFSRSRLHWLWALMAYGLACTAHVMPPVWIAAVVVYFYIAGNLEFTRRIWAFCAAAAVLIGMHFLLLGFFECRWVPLRIASPRTFAGYAGIGQLITYGPKYWATAAAVALFWAWWLVLALRKCSVRSIAGDVVIQILALHIIAAAVTPVDIIRSSRTLIGAYLLDARLSLLTALVICVLLARVRPPRWHAVVVTLCAAFFFSFAYADERAINQVEDRVRAFVSTLPRGQRLVMALRDEPPYGVPKLLHVLDRACIGHCFDYSNFEPSTLVFRLRAHEKNPWVISSFEDSTALYLGTYRVQVQDPPLYRISVCDPAAFRLCATPLRPGQIAGADKVSIMPKLW